MTSQPVQDLQACHMSLYPTMDSLLEAVQYIESRAPVHPSEVFPLLMLYHNTLIQELGRDLQYPQPVPGQRPQLKVIKGRNAE